MSGIGRKMGTTSRGDTYSCRSMSSRETEAWAAGERWDIHLCGPSDTTVSSRKKPLPRHLLTASKDFPKHRALYRCDLLHHLGSCGFLCIRKKLKGIRGVVGASETCSEGLCALHSSPHLDSYGHRQAGWESA